MDAYYDSDEEISWGPLTLREVKKELQKKSRKVNRRETDLGVYDYSVASDASGMSAYYTADESLHPQGATNKNEEFLEKLSKVINENDDVSSYASAVDTSVASRASQVNDDTLLNILKASGESDCDKLEDIHQTLVENTIRVSPSHERFSTYTIQEEASIISYISDSDEEIIIITDSSDEEFEDKLESASVKRSIKREKKSRTPVRYSSADIERVNLSAQFEESSEDEIVETLNLNSTEESVQEICDNDDDIVIPATQINVSGIDNLGSTNQSLEEDRLDFEVDSPHNERRASQSSDQSKIGLEEEKCDSSNYYQSKIGLEEDNLDSSNEERGACVLSKICEDSKESFEGRKLLHEAHNTTEIDVSSQVSDLVENLNLGDTRNNSFSSENNKSESEIFCFNDTLEEMELALKQGLDYVMPDDDSLSENIIKESPVQPAKSNVNKNKVTRTLEKPKLFKNKFNYIQSPIGDYIKKKSPSHDNFKLPLKPVKTRQTPNAKSPSVVNKTFKNIVSPVGIYIKNSPGFCLKKNVPARAIPRLIRPQSSVKSETDKENVSLCMPEVIYKPPKKTVASVEKEIILPPSIKKLVPEPISMKHERRIQTNLNKTTVSRKLLENDLTTTESSMLNMSEDVSFVTATQAFIK